MTPREIARIEIEARRMRAEVLTGMFRSLFRRAPRAKGAAVQAA